MPMPIETHEDLHRRHVVCGGGAFVFAAIIASLLGDSKPVRAQTITGSVPEVDRVSVRVVIDSYQFAVAAGKKMGSVDVQHFGWGLSGDKPPDRTLISEFGLSMHAESKRGRSRPAFMGATSSHRSQPCWHAASRHPAGRARMALIAGQTGRTTFLRSFTSTISAMP